MQDLHGPADQHGFYPVRSPDLLRQLCTKPIRMSHMSKNNQKKGEDVHVVNPNGSILIRISVVSSTKLRTIFARNFVLNEKRLCKSLMRELHSFNAKLPRTLISISFKRKVLMFKISNRITKLGILMRDRLPRQLLNRINCFKFQFHLELFSQLTSVLSFCVIQFRMICGLFRRLTSNTPLLQSYLITLSKLADSIGCVACRSGVAWQIMGRKVTIINKAIIFVGWNEIRGLRVSKTNGKFFSECS